MEDGEEAPVREEFERLLGGFMDEQHALPLNERMDLDTFLNRLQSDCEQAERGEALSLFAGHLNELVVAGTSMDSIVRRLSGLFSEGGSSATPAPSVDDHAATAAGTVDDNNLESVATKLHGWLKKRQGGTTLEKERDFRVVCKHAGPPFSVSDHTFYKILEQKVVRPCLYNFDGLDPPPSWCWAKGGAEKGAVMTNAAVLSFMIKWGHFEEAP